MHPGMQWVKILASIKRELLELQEIIKWQQYFNKVRITLKKENFTLQFNSMHKTYNWKTGFLRLCFLAYLVDDQLTVWVMN